MIKIPPTAQSKNSFEFEIAYFEWREICKPPFRIALDKKSREFQDIIVNKYQETNIFLRKTGVKYFLTECSFL